MTGPLLTDENVVGVYRRLGCHRMADELEGQDLSTLVNFLKEAGF